MQNYRKRKERKNTVDSLEEEKEEEEREGGEEEKSRALFHFFNKTGTVSEEWTSAKELLKIYSKGKKKIKLNKKKRTK